MAEVNIKTTTLRGGVKTVAFAFALSALFAFLALTFIGNYVALLPLLFLYVVASLVVPVIYLPAIHLINPRSGVVYILSVAISLLVMVAVLSRISNNSFSITLQSAFANRKDGFGMLDPYIVSNIVTYFLAARGYFEVRS